MLSGKDSNLQMLMAFSNDVKNRSCSTPRCDRAYE